MGRRAGFREQQRWQATTSAPDARRCGDQGVGETVGLAPRDDVSGPPDSPAGILVEWC